MCYNKLVFLEFLKPSFCDLILLFFLAISKSITTLKGKKTREITKVNKVFFFSQFLLVGLFERIYRVHQLSSLIPLLVEEYSMVLLFPKQH